jgi:hypothetical protein
MINTPCPRPPDWPIGHEVDEGRFWYNLPRLPKRYKGDDDSNPVFGWRVKPHYWRWEPDGLSTNLATCTCAGCSIRMEGNTDKIHVALIDLRGLSELMQVELLASYDPIRPNGKLNPCHCLILGADESPQDCAGKARIALGKIDCEFPGWPKKKLPRSNQEMQRAMEALNAQNAAFRIVNTANCDCTAPE